MKKLLFFAFLLAVLSCKDDDLNELQNSTQETTEEASAAPLDFGAAVQADFMGRIVNDEGFRINNATVKIGNQTVQTDTNGVFSIQEATVFENFALIKVTKDNYIKGSRAVIPQVNGINSVEITLLRKNIVETVNSGESSQVTYENSTVYFQGEFEYPDGTPYNGQVDVSVHYLKPNVPETFSSMPGMLLGEDSNGNAQSMETYGMLAVNLFDQAGDELDIAENFPATLEFHVDPDQAGIAPAEIPLWYFDEEMGYWKEEGSAVKQGNKFVGEVAHFTWWNCDLPLDYVTLCLSLMANEQTLNGNYIELIRNETGQTIFYGTLDINGSECGLIPANESITLNIYGNSIACLDEIIFQETIGPYSIDTTINLVIPPENFETTLITGNVLNCDNTPLQEGFGIIFDGSNGFVAGPIPVINGVLSYQFSFCGDLDYKIRVFDLNTLQASELIYLDVNQAEVVLGTIPLCEEQSLIYEGDVYINSQEQVDAFGAFGYVEINGTLYMDSLIGGGTEINSLQPLYALEKINGSVQFVILDGLESLDGLENLLSIGNLLRLTSLPNLESLEALGNLVEVNGLIVSGMDALTSLDGLQNITTLETIKIQSNNSLISLDGLNGLSSITGSGSYIRSNSGLTTLNGFDNLMSVVDIEVGSNEVNNGNPTLTDFCALQNLFINGTYDEEEILIENNAYNPTAQDIIDGNCSL